MLMTMIADTAFQASGPWLCDLPLDGLQTAGSLIEERSAYDLLESWELDDPGFLPSTMVTDLAALLSSDVEEDDSVSMQTLSTPDLDLLSSSVLSVFEDSEDGMTLPTSEESVSFTVSESSLFTALDDSSLQNDCVSVAASTSSGYSSGCESCISNEDNARGKLHRSFHPSSKVSSSASLSEKKVPTRRKKLRKSDSNSSKALNKKWSSMSEEEQRRVINDLTHVISTELGMRERLEAIHIINPHAIVSPTDTECYIDMAPINDSRFSNLQKFVKLYTGHVLSHSSFLSTHHNQRRQEKQDNFSSTYAEDHLVMCTKSRGRKRKSRNSRREQKALCQQLSKEEVQRLKEEQSGYFVHEVRIAVSSSNADEEEDDDENVDILE